MISSYERLVLSRRSDIDLIILFVDSSGLMQIFAPGFFIIDPNVSPFSLKITSLMVDAPASRLKKVLKEEFLKAMI